MATKKKAAAPAKRKKRRSPAIPKVNHVDCLMTIIDGGATATECIDLVRAYLQGKDLNKNALLKKVSELANRQEPRSQRRELIKDYLQSQ